MTEQIHRVKTDCRVDFSDGSEVDADGNVVSAIVTEVEANLTCMSAIVVAWCFDYPSYFILGNISMISEEQMN